MPETADNLPVPTKVRRPDWKCQMAADLKDEDLSRHPDVPEDIERMTRYLRRRDEESTEMNKLWIESCYPHIHGAARLDMRRDENTRMHVECAILSNVGAPQVMGVTPEVDPGMFESYENYFFNVRPYLDNEAFIVEQITPSVVPGESDSIPTIHDLRRMVAYFGGWNQHLQFTGDPRGFCRDTEMILHGIGRKSETCKAVLASLRQEVTDDNAGMIIGQYMNRRADEPEESQEDQVMQQLRGLEEDLAIEPAHEGDMETEAEYVEIPER